MQQRHKVKAQTWITNEKSDKGNQVGVWLRDCRPLCTFYLSSVWGRSPEDACWSSLWVPTDWWLWAHVVVPLVAKESTCNPEAAWASMQKQKEQNRGGHPWCTQYPMCLSATQGSPAQCSKWHHWHCPIHWKCWTSGGALGWDQPSEAHRGEGLWAPTSCRTRCGPSPICCTGAPEAHPRPWRTTLPEVIWSLAPFAAIASTCHTLLFLDHFPRADTAQNQAALHAPPKGIALTTRVALPHVVFATGRDHVVHSDGCSPCHHHPQWWWKEQGNGRSAGVPGSDDR